MNNEKTEGEWTSLFGKALSFREETARAIEVKADFISETAAPGASDLCRIKIVLKDLPGWREPLWATDAQWLYLRRPEGVWKTRLPARDLVKEGVLFQTRPGANKHYGGTSLGNCFDQKPGWKLFAQPCEPWELDFPQGKDENGNKFCSMLCEVAESDESRLVLLAGPAFSARPVAWRLEKDRILSILSNGATIVFPIAAGVDLQPSAKSGRLWLRNATWKHDWIDPMDYLVEL